MKTKKSFGERVLNVWAAIVRTLMARYCVEYLTLKTRKNAEKYLLGAEKELALIDKLKLCNEKIAARVWSSGTKVALLSRKCPALINEIKTEKEFDAVLLTGRDRFIIAAMRVYTPSRAKMLNILSMFDVVTLCIIARSVPVVFDMLKPWEILGVKEKEACLDWKKWKLALALAETKSVWAPLFLIELWKVTPNKLGNEGQELMDKFFDIAFVAKEDVSELMCFFCVFQEEKYARVRDYHYKYKCFTSYFRMVFPQLLQDLHVSPLYLAMDAINLSGKLTRENDVYAWLKIGYEHLDEQGILECLLSCLTDIRQNTNDTLYQQLLNRMVTKADFSSLLVLYDYVEPKGKKQVQRLLIDRYVATGARGMSVAFPFKEWEESLATEALLAMAAKKEIPVKRLGELSAKLQNVAITAMEEQAQIRVIQLKDADSLLEQSELLPQAEIELLKSRDYTVAYKRLYVERKQMSESAFRFLVYSQDGDVSVRVDLLYRHIIQWGLLQSQYYMLLQSQFSQMAPFVKKYIKVKAEKNK